MCYDIIGSIKLFLENNLIKTGLVTLLGAFVGAWAAFLFEKDETKKQIINKQNSVLIRAQFILMAELRQIIGIKEFYIRDIEKYRAYIDRLKEYSDDYYQTRAILLGVHFPLELDTEIRIDELIFMLKKQGGSHEVLRKILAVYAGFHQLLNELDRRNKIQLEIIPIIKKIPEENFNLEEIKRRVSIDIRYLTAITDKIISLYDELLIGYSNTLNLLISFINNAKEYNDKSLPVYMPEEYKEFFPATNQLLSKIVWIPNNLKRDI